MPNEAPLIVHVIHRLDVGGMENGLVNLINHMPVEKYRHAIVSLTESTSFRERIQRDDVECYSLYKKPGHDFGLYVRLWKLLRRLRPAIVHTRNLAAVEAIVPAALAGVPCRVHGEHGRDLQDVDGTKRRYQLLRRAIAPLVHRFIALSGELASYLSEAVGVAPLKVARIINGVDVRKFRPATGGRNPLPEKSSVDASDGLVIGTVTRMQAVKDPLTLVRGFAKLVSGALSTPVKLVMVGDGPLLGDVADAVRSLGMEEHVWLAGSRDDVPELLQSFDVFALSSRVEGISNTVLEAMATALPVVATNVGGNDELIEDKKTGILVPAGSPEAIAAALAYYVEDHPEAIKEHGRAGRERAERSFDIAVMVARYLEVYDGVMAQRGLEIRADVSEGSTSACAG
jgi:sugar transferase (PEP-CTERM/EpsH1 system associated)